MPRLPLARCLFAISLSLAACATGEPGADGGMVGTPTDAGRDAGDSSDAGSSDAGSSDAGPGDAGSSDAGSTSDAGSPAFGGGFAFDGGSGGFGGGSCAASRTPIVFLHGNGDDANVWSRPSSSGGPSVLAALGAVGYRDCELFGLTWLTPGEQATPELVFHDAARAALVRRFLDAVRAYTGKPQVDLVAHSMGATLALHALEGSGQDAGLRRFVSISGGLRGLDSCLALGPANPVAPTCGAQSLVDADTFGFYPSSNARMESGGFRARPSSSAAKFYSIRAGQSDEVLCAASIPGCASALFDDSPGVIAQLDVGQGAPTVALGNDDSTGVGHFRARSNAGPLLVHLLTTDCAGASCCAGIAGTCAP